MVRALLLVLAGAVALAAPASAQAPVATAGAARADPARPPGSAEADTSVFELERLAVHAGGPEGLVPAGELAVAIDGHEMQRRLGASLASLLDGEAGLTRQAMGPAAERPVLRGLGGYRLPVFSDQTHTGDLSTTAPDHALAVEPLLLLAAEVVRGPAALQFAGGTPAGLINLRGGSLLEQRLDGPTLQLGGQLASASSTAAGHLRLGAPVGQLGLQIDLAGRRADDLRTPAGRTRNTGQRLWQAGTGLSHAGRRGYAGVGVSRYENAYGVPGGFLGGHAAGVDVELQRTRLEARGELRPEGGPLGRLEAQLVFSRYAHRELESTGVCGVSFSQLMHLATVRTRLRRLGPLRDPVVGASVERRDLAMACLSFLPPTVETSSGAFIYDEIALGRGVLTAALRWDGRAVVPARGDSTKAGRVRERSFGGLAAALAAEWPVHRGFALRADIARTYRPPAIEELFAAGPHLAAYSYEVGNADLAAERGTTVEISGRQRGSRLEATVSVFRSAIGGFIHAVDTGELEWGPGEEGYLARYQQRGRDVVLLGGEVGFVWRPGPGWRIRLAASSVRGTLRGDGRPLPRIPPMNARLEVRRQTAGWGTGATLRGAAAQRRLGEFEEATAGYLAADVWVEWSLRQGLGLHTLVLRVENLTDAIYRNHLSRLKAIMPEAGRNVSLGYRIYL